MPVSEQKMLDLVPHVARRRSDCAADDARTIFGGDSAAFDSLADVPRGDARARARRCRCQAGREDR